MKATIASTGKLVIQSEQESEEYLLMKWFEDCVRDKVTLQIITDSAGRLVINKEGKS